MNNRPYPVLFQRHARLYLICATFLCIEKPRCFFGDSPKPHYAPLKSPDYYDLVFSVSICPWCWGCGRPSFVLQSSNKVFADLIACFPACSFAWELTGSSTLCRLRVLSLDDRSAIDWSLHSLLTAPCCHYSRCRPRVSIIQAVYPSCYRFWNLYGITASYIA